MTKPKVQPNDNEPLHVVHDTPTPKGAPQVLLHRILLRPIPPKETKDLGGGLVIHLPAATQEAEEISTHVSEVVDIGRGAYRDRITGNNWVGAPLLAVGDFVITAKYAGQLVQVGDIKYRIINDDEILARIDDPKTVKAFI